MDFVELWDWLQTYTDEKEGAAWQLFEELKVAEDDLMAIVFEEDDLSEEEEAYISQLADEMWIAQRIAYLLSHGGGGGVEDDAAQATSGFLQFILTPRGQTEYRPAEVGDHDWAVYCHLVGEHEDFRREWDRLLDKVTALSAKD